MRLHGLDTPERVLPAPAPGARTLALCVVASLVVHASLLLVFPVLRPHPASPSVTRLLLASISARAPASPMHEARKSAEPGRARRAADPHRAPEPPRAVVAEPVRTAVAAPVEAAAPAAAASAAVPAAVKAATAPLPRADASQPPSAGIPAPEVQAPAGAIARAPDEPDPSSIRQFQRALIDVASRFKRYPAQALERGWQGKVEIRLVIGPAGTLQSGTVSASSGHEVLDSQALDMVKRAKPLAPLPAALRGREFSVDIPVIFDLRSG